MNAQSTATGLRGRASERYHALYDTLADGVLFVNPAGEVLQANPAAARMLRMTQPEIRSRNINAPAWAGIRPDGTPRPHAERAIQRAMRERCVVSNVEMGVRRADGTVCWINSSASPLFDEAGELEGVVAFLSDISARREAEDLLRLQRDLAVAVLGQDRLDEALQKLLELACRVPGVDSGGIYRIDEKTGRAELLAHRGVSAAHAALAARIEPDDPRSRQLLPGQPIYLDRDASLAIDYNGVRSAEGFRALAVIPQHFEGRVAAALCLASHTVDSFSSGARAAIESIAASMGGAIARLDAQQANRRAGEELRLSEERYRLIVEHAGANIIVVDVDGVFRFLNSVAARAAGLASAEEAVGRRMTDLFPPAIAERQLASVRQVAETGKVFRGEAPTVLNGREFWFATTLVPFPATVYARPSVLLISIDITDLKRMANEILQISDWEKQRVGQDLHDTLGQQLAGLSYLSQALAQNWKTRPPADAEKAVLQLAEETRQAMTLMRQVARGLAPVTPGPDGLVAALRDVSARAKLIHDVECLVEADAEVAVSDHQAPTHLFFIAQEAVTNAVRHGHARHIVIRLRQDGPWSELSIQDDGGGMPAGNGNDQGMGLRIMQHRASLIGGSLAVEPVPSGGTRVVCRFGGTAGSASSVPE